MIAWLAAIAPVAAMILFMAVFAGFAVWALMPSNGPKFDAYRHIPFKERQSGE